MAYFYMGGTQGHQQRDRFGKLVLENVAVEGRRRAIAIRNAGVADVKHVSFRVSRCKRECLGFRLRDQVDVNRLAGSSPSLNRSFRYLEPCDPKRCDASGRKRDTNH